MTLGHKLTGSSMHAIRLTHCAAVDGRDFSVPSEESTCNHISINGNHLQNACILPYIDFDGVSQMIRRRQPSLCFLSLNGDILGNEAVFQLQASRLSDVVVNVLRLKQFAQLANKLGLQNNCEMRQKLF